MSPELYKNLEAIIGLLKSNVYAATDALDCDDGVKFFSEKAKESDTSMAEVYFFIRKPISMKYRMIFRRLARQSILRKSLKITSKGIRGTYKKTVPYYEIGMSEEAGPDARARPTCGIGRGRRRGWTGWSWPT